MQIRITIAEGIGANVVALHEVSGRRARLIAAEQDAAPVGGDDIAGSGDRAADEVARGRPGRLAGNPARDDDTAQTIAERLTSV